MSKNHLSLTFNFLSMICLLAVGFVLSICLAEIYNLSHELFPSPWLASAIVNSIFAVLVILLAWDRVWQKPATKFYWYLPAFVIFFGSLILATSSRLIFSGGAIGQKIGFEQILFVTWIPLIEEIVFRLGIGSFLRKSGGVLLGGYISALVFSLVHTMPTIHHVFSLEIGLPLGPFLLGLIAEAIYVKGKSIFPCIFFHSACNSTVIVFSLIDPRWFGWLKLFFI